MTEPKLNLIDITDAKGYRMTVTYRKGIFTVTVSSPSGNHNHEELRCNYEPTWGIDVLDQEAIYKAATELAKELEKSEPPKSPNR